jgi:Domain of unknown function (DUF4936)
MTQNSQKKTLYVYYKVPLAEHAALRPKVEVFQARVREAWPGLSADLLQRPEPSAEGMETWMEIYQHPAGVSDAAMASIAQLALDMGLPPKRAAEIFIPLR